MMLNSKVKAMLALAMIVLVWVTCVATAAGVQCVTLEVWVPWSAGHPSCESFKTLAKRYNELVPDVTVNVVSVPDLATKLQLSVASGKPPDITLAYGGIIPSKIALPQLLTPLTPLMRRDKVLDEYLPALLDCFGKWKDDIYVAPYSVEPNFAVPYNIELFEQAGLDSRKPPNTIDELFSCSDKLFKTDASGKVVQVGMIPWRMYGEHTALRNWSLAFGGEDYSDGVYYKLTTSSVGSALDFMISYGDRYGGSLALEALSAKYKLYDLSHIAMQPLVSPDALQAGGLGFEIGLTYLPKAKGGVAPIWAGGQWLAIPLGSRHVEEAWKFIKWITLDLEPIRMTCAIRIAAAKAAFDGKIYSPQAIEKALPYGGATARRMGQVLAYYATLAPKAQPPKSAALFLLSRVAGAVRSVVVDRKGDPRVAMAELNRVLNQEIEDALKKATLK